MKYINNLKDLDLQIKSVDEKFMVSSDEGIQALNEFCYVVDTIVPKDPYSQEYQDTQMKLYLEISGRQYYAVANEHTPFDFDGVKNNPYPYYTKSSTTVGEQLIAQGFLIRTMNLEPNSRIVEFGPGWGNTTLHFVQMGYEVTAVDVEKSFLELIKYRAQLLSKKINLVQNDMLEFYSNEKYDAAVFFECFHHCADHLKLLKNLANSINDDGLIAFAAETIADFPYPWGLRLDGISVWSIRKCGWLELGFDTSYFMRTLLLLGWTPRRYHSDVCHLANVIIARKSNMYYEPSEITLPPDEDKTWAPKETDPSLKIRFTSGKSTISCARNINSRFVEFCISNYAKFKLDVTVKFGSVSNTFQIPKHSHQGIYKMLIQNWDGKITITSNTWQPSKVLGSSDTRKLGVAVHYFRFID